jgi:hypothetical protein
MATATDPAGGDPFIGHQIGEAHLVWNAFSFPLFKMTTGVTYIHICPPEYRMRYTKPLSMVDNPDDPESLCYEETVGKYIRRPRRLDMQIFKDFFEKTTITRRPIGKGLIGNMFLDYKIDQLHPTEFCHTRGNRHLTRTFRYSALDGESYFYSKIVQYVPFREERELYLGYESYSEAWLSIRDLYEVQQDEAERAYDVEIISLQDAILQFANADQERILETLRAEHQRQADLVDLMALSDEQLYARLNSDQRRAYESIMHTDQTFIVVSGEAGTGKSFLANALIRGFRNKRVNHRERGIRLGQIGIQRWKVAVLAPTGAASSLLDEGQTIHSFFCFGVTTDNTFVSYMSNERKEELRLLDAILIDEFSMVSSAMLDAIHELLRRIMMTDAKFGGIRVVLIGDLYQLPPQQLRENGEPDYIFHSVMWQYARYCELKVNMRKRSDSPSIVQFTQILNEFRTGDISASTIEVLEEKCRDDRQKLRMGLINDAFYTSLRSKRVDVDSANSSCVEAIAHSTATLCISMLKIVWITFWSQQTRMQF